MQLPPSPHRGEDRGKGGKRRGEGRPKDAPEAIHSAMICIKCGKTNPNWANYCEGCGVRLLKIAYSEQRFYGALDVLNDDSAVGQTKQSKWSMLETQAASELLDACDGILSGGILMEEFVQVAEYYIEFAPQQYAELEEMEMDKDATDDDRQIRTLLMEFFDSIYQGAEIMRDFIEDNDPALLDEAKELVDCADKNIYTARQIAKKGKPEQMPIPVWEPPEDPPF